VGSPNSSNSNRLREVAENLGVPAYLVDNETGIDPRWLEGKARIGITAGASAPEILVKQVVSHLKKLGATEVAPLDGLQEKVHFPLPKGL
jgi:4-hydroxy-3-methylbut-2-enyl diphosphate reductase